MRSAFDGRSRPPGIRAMTSKVGVRATVRRIAAIGIVSFALLVINAPKSANAAGSDDVMTNGNTLVIDVVADNASRARKAIRRGDYWDRRKTDYIQGTDCVKTQEGTEVPKELCAIVDVVLAYRPKPKSKAGRKRKRRAAKIVKKAK